MIDEPQSLATTWPSNEACRLGLWMSCLDPEADEAPERGTEAATPAERLRRLEAFSAA